MSDSDKALLAAAAMRAKKNALDQGGQGMSIAAKVKALSEAGFSDTEIDKIIAVDSEASTATGEASDKAEYNQQVDETLQFTKVHIMLWVFMAIGFVSILWFPFENFDGGPLAIAWMLLCFVVMFIRNIPFAFKKADYFLKR
ncbi:hypothetical protein ACFL53_00510 [Pseudomonadota bacterium]